MGSDAVGFMECANDDLQLHHSQILENGNKIVLDF